MIKVDIDEVRLANQELFECLSDIFEARKQISSLDSTLPIEVKKRRGIQSQIDNICSDIDKLDRGIHNLIKSTNSAMNIYEVAEDRIYNEAKIIGLAPKSKNVELFDRMTEKCVSIKKDGNLEKAAFVSTGTSKYENLTVRGHSSVKNSDDENDKLLIDFVIKAYEIVDEIKRRKDTVLADLFNELIAQIKIYIDERTCNAANTVQESSFVFDPSGTIALTGGVIAEGPVAKVVVANPYAAATFLMAGLFTALAPVETVNAGEDERLAEWRLNHVDAEEKSNSTYLSIPNKYPWNELPSTGKHPFDPPVDKAGNPVLKKGPNNGAMDKCGNEWNMDRQGISVGNPHWDVTHKDGSHTNVNPESSENAGEVNHGEDNFN